MTRSWAAMAGLVGLLVLRGSVVCEAQGATQVGFGVMGGYTYPSGLLSGVAESGWHAGAFLDLTAAATPIGVRLEGTWHALGDKHLPGANGSPRVLAGIFDATYTVLPRPAIQPYIIGGIGEYSVRSDVPTLIPCSTGFGNCTAVKTRSAFGFNAGFGVRLRADWFSAFVEARWHDILTNGTNTQMVPISVGIRF